MLRRLQERSLNAAKGNVASAKAIRLQPDIHERAGQYTRDQIGLQNYLVRMLDHVNQQAESLGVERKSNVTPPERSAGGGAI